MKIIELLKKSWAQIKKSSTTAWNMFGLYFIICVLSMLDSLFKKPTGWIALFSILLSVIWGYWFLRFLLLGSMSKKINFVKVFAGSWSEFWSLIRLELLIMVAILVPMLIGIIAGIGFWSFKNYLGFGIMLVLAVLFGLTLFWLSLRLGFAYYLVIDEKLGARKALSRSMELTEGKMKKILGLFVQYLLLMLPIFVYQFIVIKFALSRTIGYVFVQSLLTAGYGLLGGLVWVNFYRELNTKKVASPK